MRYIGWFLMSAVGVVVFMAMWSLAGSLVTMPDTISLMAGVALYIVILACVVGVVSALWKRIKSCILATEKNTKQTLPLVFVLASSAMMFANSSCTKVEPGYVAIRVNNYGSQKGMEDFPLLTGRVTYNPFTEDIYKFPTFLQSIVWTKNPQEGSPNDDSITFNSIEGAVLNADIALSYSFEAEKVPSIFVEFRKDAETITNVYMRSQVRDIFNRNAGTIKAVDIFGSKKQEFLDLVKKDLIERLGPKGFRFDLVSIVGGLRADQEVLNSINAVIQATQRAIEAENKVRQSEAEAQQKIAAAEGEAQSILKIAVARAEANKILSQSLTPALIQWQGVQQWNGILPQVTGSGGVPFIQLSK